MANTQYLHYTVKPQRHHPSLLLAADASLAGETIIEAVVVGGWLKRASRPEPVASVATGGGAPLGTVRWVSGCGESSVRSGFVGLCGSPLQRPAKLGR